MLFRSRSNDSAAASLADAYGEAAGYADGADAFSAPVEATSFDVPAMPDGWDDIPDADDIPYEFDAEDPDADLNSGI